MTMTPKIELKPTSWLVPYEHNAKKHPEEQLKRLAATIAAHGWDQPIVTETDGLIIKGHGRRLVALMLGLAEVPVIVRHDLTKTQAAAARIADNAAISTQYDTEIMRDELRRLITMPDIDIDSLALTGKELEFLTTALDVTNIDAVLLDTTAAIEAQQDADAAAAEAADEEQVQLTKALGFSRIKAADQRILSGFMAAAEAATESTGYDAFIGGLKLVSVRGLV